MFNPSKLKVNVLHVVSGLPPDGGGPSIVIPLTILSENKYLGISSYLLCLYSRHPVSGYEYPLSDLVGNKLVSFLRSFTCLRFSPSLLTSLFAADYDVLHIHGSWHISTSLAACICLIRKKKYIITPHGSLVRGHLVKNRILKFVWWNLIDKYAYTFASSVRLLSRLEYNEIPQYISKVFPDVSIIPNGIDFNLISDRESLEIKKDHLKSRIVSGRIRFIFFSRLSCVKGILELLSAWRAATESNPGFLENCSLDLIGPIDDSIALEVFNIVGNCQSIEYLGQVHGVDRFKQLLCHDVFVLPTKGEGLSTALLEAISSYCYVITTPMCNLNDPYLTNDFYYCQPTIPSIRDALLGFYTSFRPDAPILLKQREYVMSNYGWAFVSSLLSRLYQP